MSIYDTLNKEQKKAVFQTEGPVLILAGAGSGKTRVITHRISYLMEEVGVNPWNILAITFTNKAAGEMRERVDKLIGFGAESLWISTFHSMCVRILRRHIDLLGYDNSFTIYDTDDQKTLMKQVCRNLNINTKELKEKTILNAISSAKNELITPLRYRQDEHSDFYHRQIGDAYEEYQRLLKKNNALDFDDLLMKTVELFHAYEDVLANYQNRFRYIMVDEYQDTNNAQFELVRLLADRYRNLCVVGDDDQSIYKFRGANIRNILDFEKVYPDALVIRLEQNYRSTQTILDAANAVIRNNVGRKKKSLWTSQGKGNPIRFRQFNTAPEEAAFIAGDIRRLMRKDPRFRYSDCAILYRTNAQARVLEERFVMESIPYNVVGGTNFYERREIKDMLSYLKTIDNGRDDLAVRRIINVPKRGIGATSIGRIGEFAGAHDLGLFEALERIGEIEGVAKRTASKITPFVQMIHEFREYLEDHSLEELVKHVIEETGYEEYLRASDEEDAEDRLNNVDELVSKVVDYEQQAEEGEEGSSLSAFLEEVALVADIDEADENSDRVLMMTLHSAKGLEFPHVYMAGMEEHIFPSAMALMSEDDNDLEEERRLAYVGITRAKEDLTLTASRSRLIRGQMQYNPVSRFISEIPEELLDEEPAYKKSYDYYADDDMFDESSSGYTDELPFHTGKSGGDSSGRGRTVTFEELLKGYDQFNADTDGKNSSGTKGHGRNYGSIGPETSSGSRYAYGAASSSVHPSFGNHSSSGDRRTADRGSDRAARPKARYVKPHTSEAKKPFVAKASSSSRMSLNSIHKGIPTGTAPDYAVGDRVEHIKYGIGTVKKIEPGPRDFKVTVVFDEAGQKIMYAAFAKLKKC